MTEKQGSVNEQMIENAHRSVHHINNPIRFGDEQAAKGSMPEPIDIDACLSVEAAEIAKMRKAIKGALAISDLWLPPDDCSDEHAEEARALSAMHRAFSDLVG